VKLGLPKGIPLGLWTFMMARPSTYDPNILLGKENRGCAKEV
jgi:hypothetical protein